MYFEELYVFCDSVILLLKRFLRLNHTLSKQLKHAIDVSEVAKDHIQYLLQSDARQFDDISCTAAEHVSEFVESLREVFMETLPPQMFLEPPQLDVLPDVRAKVL